VHRSALADDGLIAIETDLTDARLRLDRVRDPALLLDASSGPDTRAGHRVTWDVGARDAAAAMPALRDAAMRLNTP
jgi:hypothetical protein